MIILNDEMERKNFDYDYVSDSLIISRKREGEMVQGSAEIGNLVLDFTSEGRIVNVEFREISKFLEMMKVDFNILNGLEGAELIVQEQNGAVSLFAILKTSTFEQVVPLTIVPVARPLVLDN